MGGYSCYNIGQVLLPMYLTYEYLVNSSIIGRVKKKLKPKGIVNGFFNQNTVGTLLLSMVNHPYRN